MGACVSGMRGLLWLQAPELENGVSLLAGNLYTATCSCLLGDQGSCGSATENQCKGRNHNPVNLWMHSHFFDSYYIRIKK